jgi:signal transduction histidine kinase
MGKSTRNLRPALGRWLLLLALIGYAGRATAGAVPLDSSRLHTLPALPDTARLRLLAALSSAHGPTSSALCIKFALRGLPLARRLGQGPVELGLLDNIAVSYARTGNLPEALRYCLLELRRARELGNRRYEIDALLGVASVQSNENNWEEAESTYQQVLALAERAGSPLRLARVRNQVGNYCLSRHRYAECERLMRLALPVFEQFGRLYEQGDCLSSLAEAAVAQQQWRAALDYGQRATALMEQKGDVYGQAWTYNVLCSAAAGSGDLPRARRYGLKAINLARQADIPGTEADVLTSLIDTYARLGAYADTYPLQQRLAHLNDSLFTRTRAAEMARMQTQYETDAKRRQIKELTNRARIQALERERDRSRLQWLSIVAALLIVALGLFALLYRRLQQSRVSLHRANKTKEQLLSIVGHDLRSPVSAFQQVAAILRHYARRPDPAELLGLADDIEHSTTQLAGLLDNMLHWARAQMNQVINQPTALPPATPIQTVVSLYRTAAALKQQTLVADLPLTDGPLVWADPALLDTVLRNLVSNAIKFTPAGGRVEVGARPTTDGRGVEFRVCDTGVGLSAGARDAITGPLLQATTTHGTAGEVGTGLGLAVCRQFVDLLGSRLTVSSQEEQGTQFGFTLPLAPSVG